MKTLMLLFHSVLFLSTGLFASVQESVVSDTSSVTVVQEKNLFLVNYKSKNAKGRNIVISIYDEQNQVVFTESLSNTGSFKKPYNFSGLPDGIYIIKITDEQMVTIRPVQYVAEVSEEKAAAAERLENLKKDLVIRVKCTDPKIGKYKVDVLSNNSHLLDLKIYDDKSKLVFEGETESKTSQVYVLRNSFSSKFRFLFFDKERNLVHEIEH